MNGIVQLDGVGVTYDASPEPVQALIDVTLKLGCGSSTAIIGRSGSGKSTLVSILTLLRRPTSGRLLIEGQDTASLRDADMSAMRSRLVGTVFQSFHLDPALTATNNVMLPWFFARGGSRADAERRAVELLDTVELGALASRRPAEMSGGQRQRVAIARALFNAPQLLVADEPTGNLDEETASHVADLLFALPGDVGTSVVVVTHDAEIASRAAVELHLTHGRVAQSVNAKDGTGRTTDGSGPQSASVKGLVSPHGQTPSTSSRRALAEGDE